jgi:hypothetical protein
MRIMRPCKEPRDLELSGGDHEQPNLRISSLERPDPAPPSADAARHSVTVSAWRWATFHSPSSRRYTCVARNL